MMMKSRLFLRSSLGGQVLYLLGIAMLSTLLVFSLSVFYFVNRTENEAWQGRQSEAARNAAGTVSGFMQRVKDSLTILSIVEPDHHVTDPDELRTLLDQNPALLEIVRTDDAGTVIASVHRDNSVLANLITIPQSQWFLEAKAGRAYIGNVQLSANNEPYLIMAVSSMEGGVVAARVQMNVLWDVVSNIHFGNSGQAYVLTRTGQIIAHTNAEVVLNNTSLRGRPEFSALIKDQDGEWLGTFENFEGNRVVGRARFIEGTEWLIMTELPWAEAYQSTRIAVTVLGTEAILLMLLVGWVMVHRVKVQVMEPMELLRKGAEEIGLGNLYHRIGLGRQDEIGQVAAAFDTMAGNLQQRDAQVEAQTAALQLSEKRYRAIVEDQTELICRFLPDGRLTFVNEAYCRYFDKRREDLIGRSFMPMIFEEDRARVEAAFASLDASNPVISYEQRVLMPDGSLRWQHWTDRLVSFEDGQIVEYASVGRDITERKQAEDDLRRLNLELEDRVRERTEALSNANESLLNEVNERKVAEAQVLESLQEKEVLLKEIHHRVKNNLQIISSLLNLQARGISDPRTLQAMSDSQARVRSMALIHEKLYQSQSLSSIDFGEYVKSLATDLFRSYRSHVSGIQLSIEVDEIVLSLDQAVSCGLILNELMTNALKYAFANRRNGTIYVELHEDHDRTIKLKVSDDGIGIPPDFDVSNAKSLGLQLVNNLARQLDATVELSLNGGTSFLISFSY